MLLDLENIPEEGQAVDRAVPLPASTDEQHEFRLARPVELSVQVSRADERAFRLNGRLDAELELGCDRCLASFASHIRENLDLLYLPQSENTALEGEDDRGLGDEELSVSFYRDEQIDLSHMVWEQVVLALPMKPLCGPECKGLCPDCGINRNTSNCDCVREETDPRWQVLKSLLDP